MTEKEGSTHCVEITRWAPGDTITFEVYDFGGHDVYHLTHQFFLTQGALNLLTVNLETYRCTEQRYSEAVGYWLGTLNARVPGSVVTIVCTKIDQCTEKEEKTRDIEKRFNHQQDTWKRNIQQQVKEIRASIETMQAKSEDKLYELKQQLERTQGLLAHPLRLTGVFCVSSAEPTSGLDTLKTHMLESANNTELFPSVRRILPRTFVDFEKHLHDLRERQSYQHQTLNVLGQESSAQSSGRGYSSSAHSVGSGRGYSSSAHSVGSDRGYSSSAHSVGSGYSSSAHSVGSDRGYSSSAHSVGSGYSPSAHSVGSDRGYSPSAHSVGSGRGYSSSAHSVGSDRGYSSSAHSVGSGRGYSPSAHSVGSGRGYSPSAHSVGSGRGYSSSVHSVGSDRGYSSSVHSVGSDRGYSPDSARPKWLTRKDCLMLGQLAGLRADRLEPVLSYLQQVGTILRYTDIPELKDLVFHDPSGLIDVIKELFHHDLEEVFTAKNPRLNGFSETDLTKIRENLSSRGFLPREIVIAQLGPHVTPVGNVDVITNLMEHFGLCYTERSGEEDGEASKPLGYCIPWYIQEYRPGTINRDVAEHGDTEYTVTCEITNFCPRGLFERLSVVVNKLIKSRQDWKDIVMAVRKKLPITVYRETTDEYVKIVIKLTIPVQMAQATHEGWGVIGPLKNKLLALLLEWPGLLYHLVWSESTLQSEQRAEQQSLRGSAIIPTFEVQPQGCTVQHGGVTLEFPEGCVVESRFISVEVEAVPVNDDIRTNFTAMSAVLTVEQDFPQRFLRPVTVRLPWVWKQAERDQEKTTTETTVVLHFSRPDGWTLFSTCTRDEDGHVVFHTDTFQSFVVAKLNAARRNVVKLWESLWKGYCEDKVYLIVSPNKVHFPEWDINLLCVHKLDDVNDFWDSGYVRRDDQFRQRIEMTNKERIKATFREESDLRVHPGDMDCLEDGIIFDYPPADRNRYSLLVEKNESVPDKLVYRGRVRYERLPMWGDAPEVTSTSEINDVTVLAYPDSQGMSGSPSRPMHTMTPQATKGESAREQPPKRPQNTDVAEKRPAKKFKSDEESASSMGLSYAVAGPSGEPSQTKHLAKRSGKKKTTDDPETPSGVKPVVLLVNDEFGTSKGGISTINGQLGNLLTREGATVHCTVVNATTEEIQEAQSHGIHLVVPDTPKGDKRSPTLDWLTFDHKSRYPNLPSDISVIVGHADVTSRAARNIKKERLPSAKFILYNHVMPEDTEHHKTGDKAMGIGDKMAAIREDTEKADVVFSVGPTMHDYYKTQIKLSKPHHLFLPRPSDIFSRMEVTYVETETKVVLTVGRVRGVEKLKGYDLVAKSMGKVLDRFPRARWRTRGVSKDDFPESKKIIEANIAKGKFFFTPLEYGTQHQLSRDFKEAHLVLMPSRAEPFGLVGLEAIAAGVPVLVSSNSGLAEFLERKGPEFDRPIVDMDGSDDVVAERLAKRIIKVLKGGRAEFEAAKRLKDKLMASKYWEQSHRNFLEECGISQ